jgi:hypothetical protein
MFTWKWSYQNTSGHRFEAGEIEVHRENDRFGLREYQRKIFNGDDAEFQRNVIDPIGGAVARIDGAPNRWTKALYEAFTVYCRDNDFAARQSLERMRAEHPDFTFDEPEPLAIPRPIYWDYETNRFETEPFYEAITKEIV